LETTTITDTTFTTKHPNGIEQQQLINYLQKQGATITYRDNINHTTKYSAPEETATTHHSSISYMIIEWNGKPVIPKKSARRQHELMEYKWCKQNQGDCATCALGITYCSRKLNKKP